MLKVETFDISEIPSENRTKRHAGSSTKLDIIEFANEIGVEIVNRALVKNLIWPRDLCVLYGPSGCGKSFVALDLCFAIALGCDWNGLKVKEPAPVLYVGLEGARGLRNRIVAALNQHGDPGKYFGRMVEPSLLIKGKDGDNGVEEIHKTAIALSEAADADCKLIVIDTLARAIAGDDENSAADMSNFVERRASEIARRTGAAVLVVHHSGKDAARGMRGSNALFGASDLVIQIDEDRTLNFEKVKDGEAGKRISFELDPVELATDEDGDTITTCVVRYCFGALRQQPKASDAQKALIRCLQDLIVGGTCETKTGVDWIPDGKKCAKSIDLIEHAFKRGDVTTSKNDKSAKETIRGQIKKAVQKGLIGCYDKYVWLVD